MLTLLKLLQDGCFHSGQDLGDALGVSRSAVWKQLQRLEAQFGVSVHKVPGRGYRLAMPFNLLEAKNLILPRGWSLRLYDALDSTNAEAARLLGHGLEPPFVVLAEQQTAGRGRRGRKWRSPFAENLYCSVTLRIVNGARQLEGLSLVVGLAVMRALRVLGLDDVGLKWPNDLQVRGKKIAGILLELTGDPADVCHVVIGIGVNVNMRYGGDIDQPWTSMCLEQAQAIDRNQLVNELSQQLHGYLLRHAEHGFSIFQNEWEVNHSWQGREVALISGRQRIEGTVLGIDGVGALRLSVNGMEQKYNGGELSLRLRDDS